MRGGFFLASLALHSILIGMLIAQPSRGIRPARTLNISDKQRIVYTALLKQAAKVQRAQAAKARVTMPNKASAAAAKKAKPEKIAKNNVKKPKPMPTPEASSSIPASASTKLTVEEKIATLKKLPYFSGWSDADLKNLELPPGVSDWGQVAAITDMLDKSNWIGAPPELEHNASKSGDVNPLEAANVLADMLAAFENKDEIGYRINVNNGRYTMAFNYTDMMFIARWNEADAKARVCYYPKKGGKEDPNKVFEVPVDPDKNLDNKQANMAANIIIGYQAAGMPR